jgi:putative oxidoreductase
MLSGNGAVLAGRILLAAMYVFSGTMKFVDVSGTAGHIADKGLPAPELVAIAAGTLEVVAGLAVMIGWRTRIAAIALAGFTVLAGVLFHNFWAYEGQEQVAQMLNLFKNITIAGGFMILAVYGPGRYSLDARRGHTIPSDGLRIA